MASKGGVVAAEDEAPRTLREVIKKKFLDEVIGVSGLFILYGMRRLYFHLDC